MIPLRAWVNTGAMTVKSTSHSPKLQHYWSLTIRYFSVISRTMVRGVLPQCKDVVSVFDSSSQLGRESLESYSGYSLWEFYSYAKMPSVYFTAPSNWDKLDLVYVRKVINLFYDFVNLYPPVHFLCMYLSVIIAITNYSGESETRWKMPSPLFYLFALSSFSIQYNCPSSYHHRIWSARKNREGGGGSMEGNKWIFMNTLQR